MDIQDLIIGKSKPAFVTESGIKLYLDNEMVKLLNRRIEQLNLKNIQTFLALHPDGNIEYLLVKDGKPYHESRKIEDIESNIEVLALTQKFHDPKFRRVLPKDVITSRNVTDDV